MHVVHDEYIINADTLLLCMHICLYAVYVEWCEWNCQHNKVVDSKSKYP